MNPPIAIPGYEIVRELSHGGQGVVYQAVQRATKQKVAIKVLLEGPYASPTTRRRFEREIELVAQLKHPHIVSVFHAGQTPDGRQFYVMEYVRGTPLVAYVREKNWASKRRCGYSRRSATRSNSPTARFWRSSSASRSALGCL